MSANQTNAFTDTLRSRIAYDGTRTPLKTALFLLVCVAWLLPGLVGHDPWKTEDAIVFSVVIEMLRTGDWVVHTIAGERWLEKAPLFYWVSAITAKLFGGFLAVHDAARLASGVFMAATLTAVSLAARELMGVRAARISVLLFIGCLGLLLRAHEMNVDLAGLTGIALGLYGLALSRRMPRIGGAVTGAALGLAFLGDGFLPLLLLAGLMAALPLAGSDWRTRDYATAAVVAVLCAAPLLAIWPLMLAKAGVLPEWLARATATRWSDPDSRTPLADLVYFAKILPWYSWPAGPLAAWSLWRARKSLTVRADLMLPFVALLVFFVGISLFAEARELNAMPLLLPLALLGVAEIDSLRRGAASALDWFGMTTFFLIGALIWVGYVAAITGSPQVMAAWLEKEVPGYTYQFSFLPFALAALLTLIWLVVVARSLRTTRRALVNWAAGITMVWMLAMTLGVPLVDHTRSYRGVSNKLIQVVPIGYQCAIGVGLGDAQRALLSHFAGMRFIRAEHPAERTCKIRLVQAPPKAIPAAPEGWKELWRGSRPGDESEAFVLYQRSDWVPRKPPP